MLIKVQICVFLRPLELGVERKVDKVMSALRVWTDMTFGLETPVKVIGFPLKDSEILGYQSSFDDYTLDLR